MKNFLAAFMMLFLLIAPVSAFAGKADFIICNLAEPQTLDPAFMQGNVEHQIYFALYEGLVTTDPKTAKAIPGVAESWTRSKDGKTYTFKLRKTTWDDGVPITANTFVKSWLRMLDPKTASPYAWFPSMFIAGAEDFNTGKNTDPNSVKIRALDDYTFQIDLVGSFPYVLDALAHYAFSPVPLHAIEKHRNEWTTPGNFVGNGPFTLKKWIPQSKIIVLPNKKYWDSENVHLSSVTFLAIEDDNTAHNMYLNGEADYCRTIPTNQIEAVQLRDDYHNYAELATYYYTIQCEKKPFDDPRVRKALGMSINKQILVEKVTKAGQIPAKSFVPEMAGYTTATGLSYDVEGARKLLTEAGFSGGKGFPAFEILYNTQEGHKKIAEYIQQEWELNLGIKVTLRNQEWKTYLATKNAGDFNGIARAGWIGDYRDPNTFLELMISGSAMNGGKYSNPKYDELIKKAATISDPKQRMQTLHEAEEILITQDQAVIPIYFYTSNKMIDTSKWGGWYPNVMSWHPLKDIYRK